MWLRGLHPVWRVRHWLAPFPMPFVPSPIDFREWNVELDSTVPVPKVPLPPDGKLRVSLHRLLIEAGIALTPATSSWDPRSWFALYRYGADFAGTAPLLRFYEGVGGKDPRLTAVASEEVATGITCYVLREILGLTHIADAYACIQRGELAYANQDSEKRPDYFCQDTKGETVLAESKGATGTRSSIRRRIDPEGWSQVQNVEPVNLPLRSSCGRVVIGTHFCIENAHPKSETTTIIKDPEGEEGMPRNPESDMLIRLAYAKCLRFMIQDVLAERLLLRHTVREMLELDAEPVRGIPFVALQVTPFGDIIGLFEPTLKALFGEPTQMRNALAESLRRFEDGRDRLGQAGYALLNGVIVFHEWRESL